MTILEYIDKYGNKTFDEEKFNEVDNVILSAISYIDFNGIVKSGFSKIRLSDAADMYLKNFKTLKNKMGAYKTAITILKKIKETNRFKDLLLYNYYYIGNIEQQFSAITIELNPKLVYISFEGTDNLVSGWEEDFKIAYMFPIKAQRNAINYINKYIFTRKNIIIGGHSKGGNLAIVAGMYANRFTKKRIVNVYCNDGPGLRKKQFTSREYQELALKLVSIIPDYSIVGLLLRHSKKYKVIKSRKKGIMAHDLINWQVKDTEFERADLSKVSTIFDNSMSMWLDKYDDEQRKMFVDSLFNIFRKTGINDLEEIMNKKTLILKLAVEARNISKTTKTMIKEFVQVVIEYMKVNKE